jgi:GH25 family lysozyme M1 (1,4-beta-N-acetylmuramidase)
MARRSASEQTPLKSAQRLARLVEEDVIPRLTDHATDGDGNSDGGVPDRPDPDEDATRVPAAARQALEALYPQLSSDSAAALAALFASADGADESDAPHGTPGEDADRPVDTQPRDGAPIPMRAASVRARSTTARGGGIAIAPGVRIGPVGRLLLEILKHYPRRGQLTISDGYRSPSLGRSHHSGLSYGGSPTAALDIVAAGPARMRDVAKWLYDHFAGDIVELIHTTPFNTDRGFYVKNQKKNPGGSIYGAQLRREHRNHVHFASSKKLALKILARLRRKPVAPRVAVRAAPGVAPPAVWGWDASGHDWKRGPMDLVAARKDGISFFTHKCSEGHTFKVAEYKRGLERARAARIPVLGAYHVLWPGSPGNPIREARFFFNLVNTKTPWWKDVPWIWQLDAEKFEQMPRKPSPAECKQFMTELKRLAGGRGYFVAYAPRWAYGDTFRIGFDLWASDYSGSGAARPFKEQYKGVPQKSWRPYSGRRPRILQFASDATIGRQKKCDADRFRGSLQQLLALSGRKAAPRPVRPSAPAPGRRPAPAPRHSPLTQSA